MNFGALWSHSGPLCVGPTVNTLCWADVGAISDQRYTSNSSTLHDALAQRWPNYMCVCWRKVRNMTWIQRQFGRRANIGPTVKS